MPEETVTGTEIVLAGEMPLWNPDNDFRKLALDVAETSAGFRLVDKSDLVGVPFVIKRVVYRPGYPRAGAEGDYVSVECVIADKDTLALEPVKAGLPEPLTVFGNEGVVFNDSGTGVRRKITEMLESANLIHCGTSSNGENPWDRPFQLWTKGSEDAEGGFSGLDFDPPVQGLYLALRGLRVSEYEYQGNPAETYYFG